MNKPSKKELNEFKREADEIIELDSFNDVPLKGTAKRIAEAELEYKNIYGYRQEGKKKLLILNHI